MDVREKLVDDVHSKLMGLLQRAPYIRCEDVHRQYAVNWLMNNGVTLQEWIPVSDSPKERGEYTVLEKHWVDGHLEVRKGRWNGVEWFVDGHESMLVAYWLPNLPLPELPKEEAHGSSDC